VSPRKCVVKWLCHHQPCGWPHTSQSMNLRASMHNNPISNCWWMFQSGKSRKQCRMQRSPKDCRVLPLIWPMFIGGILAHLTWFPFDHYYFSSLTELFEVMWQQICGFPWWDMDANRCWFVCNQNQPQERHCKRGYAWNCVLMTAIPASPQKCGSSRRLSVPYLLSGRKDSFDLNLPALWAPFCIVGWWSESWGTNGVKMMGYN
jgi:hypothetical protein